MNNRQAAVIAAASTMGKVVVGDFENTLYKRTARIKDWLDEQDRLEAGGLPDATEELRAHLGARDVRAV